MIGYRKKSFWRAHAMLQALRKDDSDFGALKELQILLLKEIMRAEKQVRALKTELKSLAAGSERRTRFLDNRIDGLRDVMFTWRCFGDAIAFLYMDKFALKHTFYSTHEYKPKNDAGFILGKEGLPHEFGLVLSALEHKVPAMLTDLTTTIRHGDVCLMGNHDPYLIEVKANKSKNPRAKRQKQNLEILHEFYDTDRSIRLRGMGHVIRQAHSIPERGYAAELNRCIGMALNEGFAICTPEPGLKYVVMMTKDAQVKDIMSSIDLEAPWMFMPNAERKDRSWAPYYPFTLTIENVEHLWSFIRGEIYILVLVSTKALEKIATNLGHESAFDREDETYPFRVNFGDGEGGLRLSADILARIGMECVSPNWLVTSSIKTFLEGGYTAELDANGSPNFIKDPQLRAMAKKYMLEAGFDPDVEPIF